MATSFHSIPSYLNRLHGGVVAVCFVVFSVGVSALGQPAGAQRLENKVAVFAALDKVTAKIRRLEIPLDDTVVFGSLRVTPRICYSRLPTERPKTTSFVEINETEIDGTEKMIFSGWMFAQSPGLNALEHPVFDIWLTGCQQPSDAPSSGGVQSEAASEPAIGDAAEPVRRPHRRRRVRR